MPDRIEALKELAQRAKEAPFNSKQARNLECACDPSTILKLVAVVEKARIVRSQLTEFDEVDYDAELALRSALAALDDREPA